MTDLSLILTVTIEASSLKVHYAVQNRESSDVYLLNRVHDRALEPRPELVYTELDAHEKLVHLYKDIPPIPAGMSPAMPYSPYVTVVRAGGQFSETFQVATPIRENAAYLPQPPDGVRATYAGVRLTLGYYWSVPGMREQTGRTNEGQAFISPVPPPGTQLSFGKLEQVERLSVTVIEPKPKSP